MAKRKKSRAGGKTKTKRKKNRSKSPVAAPAPKKRSKKRGRKRAAAPVAGTKRKRGRSRKGRKHTKWGVVKRHKRRTNPSGQFVQIAIAGGAGIAAYLATLAATYYATKDSAQSTRNRKIAGAIIAVIAAVFVVKKKPLIAAGVAAGGLLAGFGDFLTLKLMQYLPQKAQTNTSAVYAENMQALLPAQSIDAVYQENMQGLERAQGEFAPPAPWSQPGPFG